jgi:hypothetical protein
MTDRKVDFDALVQETMAFTKSIRVEPAMPKHRCRTAPVPPVNLDNSERDEIRRRVSSFKAHQDRFAREREDYGSGPAEKDAGAVGTGPKWLVEAYA